MHQLGILSCQAGQYAALFQHAELSGIKLLFANEQAASPQQLAKVDILLADPDLAVKALEHCHQLKWLQSTWAGNKPLFDHPKRNYLLSGVKDVFQAAMVEYVFAYILYFSRNIDGFRQQQLKAKWHAPGFTSLGKRRLGIIGVGNIGQGVARAAKQFGMHVNGLSFHSRDCEAVDQYYQWDQAAEFCHGLDFLLCLLPHSQLTEGKIDQHFLALLPPECILINAGRGQTIVEQDLLNCLQNKRLKAAVLDVFEQEPLPATHPFWQMDNVYITQHTAAKSQPSEIFTIFKHNAALFSQNQPLHGQLNFLRGY